MTVEGSINKNYVDEIIENNNINSNNDDTKNNKNDDNNEQGDNNEPDDNNEPEDADDTKNNNEPDDADADDNDADDDADDDAGDDEILEAVLGSMFLGSIIGILFGVIIGYYKGNFLLGLLISITLTLVTSASTEYYVYNSMEQINYYRVLVGLPPIENFFKGISKGFKTIGKGIVTATNVVASLGEAAIKGIIKGVIEPMFSGVKKTLTGVLDNTLLKPVKLLQDLIKKVTDGIELAIRAIVKVTEQLAAYTTKIPKIFIAFIQSLFDSIILPMLGVFKGFVTILMGVVELLLIIIKKIVSIPRCIGVYIYYGTMLFFNNIFIQMLPGWLGKIITIMMSFISFIFNTIYWIFYFMVYPLKLVGWDMIENLKDYFKSDCMIINFRPALDKMKDGVLMLIPKFKPIKIKI